MKIRTGFVSNSSSTSYTCDLCAESYEVYDDDPSNFIIVFDCIQRHTICKVDLSKIIALNPTTFSAGVGTAQELIYACKDIFYDYKYASSEKHSTPGGVSQECIDEIFTQCESMLKDPVVGEVISDMLMSEDIRNGYIDRPEPAKSNLDLFVEMTKKGFVQLSDTEKNTYISTLVSICISLDNTPRFPEKYCPFCNGKLATYRDAISLLIRLGLDNVTIAKILQEDEPDATKRFTDTSKNFNKFITCT